MITKHLFASPKTDVKKSLSPSKSKTANKKQQSKNRIKARLLTSFGRKVIAQRILMKALACQESERAPSSLVSLTSHPKASPSSGASLTTKNTLLLHDSHSEPLHYPAEFMRVPKPNAQVKFQETVSVKEIPSHRSYGEETRKTMWNCRKEIERNCLRNKREFAADGRDWRSCKEEDEMLVLEGQLVHPETYLWLQRRRQQSVVQKLRDAKKMEYQAIANINHQTRTGGHAAAISRGCGSMGLPSKTYSMVRQQPFQDSSNQTLAAVKVGRVNVGGEGESVLDFPSLSSAATDAIVSSCRRLTQDHCPEQGDRKKPLPVRKAAKSSKFQVRRRTTLFRLPTRTAKAV